MSTVWVPFESANEQRLKSLEASIRIQSIYQ